MSSSINSVSHGDLPFAQFRQLHKCERRIIAKGFKRVAGGYNYTRPDADLYFHCMGKVWTVDIYKTVDGVRGALVTRKANIMLFSLLNSFM